MADLSFKTSSSSPATSLPLPFILNRDSTIEPLEFKFCCVWILCFNLHVRDPFKIAAVCSFFLSTSSLSSRSSSNSFTLPCIASISDVRKAILDCATFNSCVCSVSFFSRSAARFQSVSRSCSNMVYKDLVSSFLFFSRRITFCSSNCFSIATSL